jgi:predicted DNA-binding ribbon-helix-helix protein
VRRKRRLASAVRKRAVSVAGHKTSVSLEDTFWEALEEIARQHDTTRAKLIAAIDSERKHTNLSSVIRVYVLDFYRSAARVA